MVTPIRAILKDAARKWGIEPAAHLAAARAAWPGVVGPALAAVSAPVSLRGRRLLVGVKNAAAGQEVRLRGHAIAAALGRELGTRAVTDVVPVHRQHLDLPLSRAVARRSKKAES